MELSTLLVVLSLVTMLLVVVLSAVSKRKTEQRKADPDAPKSALAADGPDGK